MKRTIRRNQGRPSMGKVKVTITMTEDGRASAFELAMKRGMTMGSLFEELLRQELRQLQDQPNRR